jgi:hypothetical protein
MCTCPSHWSRDLLLIHPHVFRSRRDTAEKISAGALNTKGCYHGEGGARGSDDGLDKNMSGDGDLLARVTPPTTR